MPASAPVAYLSARIACLLVVARSGPPGI